MRIQSEHLVMREYDRSDFEAVHRFASDPELTTHTDWGPNSEADTRAFLEECLQDQASPQRGAYTFAITADGALIGSVGIHRGPENHAAEVGFVISREHWGRGYATEAAREVVRFGFEHLGLHRIAATCRPQNAASIRVLEKVGMRREGHLRHHLRIRGQWADSLLFAVIETSQ